MSNIFGHKSKKKDINTGQNTNIGTPSIQVEQTPPREGSFRQKAKEKVETLLSHIRPSHSRAASRSRDEGKGSQAYPPVVDANVDTNMGNKDPKNNPNESRGHTKTVDGRETGEMVTDKSVDNLMNVPGKTLLGLPREDSFRSKAKETLQSLFPPRSSHSRASSRDPSERGKSQEYLPVPLIPNIDDKDQSVDIKDDPGESLKLADHLITGPANECSADKSVDLPTDGPAATIEINRTAVYDAIQASKRQVQGMHTIGGGVQKAVDYEAQATALLDTTDVATSFLKPLQMFDSVVKGLGDVHPYAKVALSVLSWASQAILAQANRDQSIQDLQSRVADVYEFMLEDNRLEILISMKDILSQTSQVMLECAKFIQVYSQPSFVSRLGKGVFSGTDDALAKYTNTIDNLMQQFQQYALRDALIYTHDTRGDIRHALEEIRQLGDNQYLDRIAYAEGAGLDTEKACLEGTREELLRETIDWVNDADPDVPRILWLSGPAGAGKSAIAHSIAHAMKDAGALGSCFCFKKGDINRYTKLFTTISRDLAGRDLRLKQALAGVVARDPSVATTVDIVQQWENLIKEPLSITLGDAIGRVVLVIDALDESGDPQTRKRILFLLTKQASTLPSNMRILITSRPLPDIRKAFDGIPHVKRKSMDDIPLSLTERDIQSYISNQLSDANYSFSNEEITALSKKADGLFEWARLACSHIMSDKAGLSELERFETLMLQTEGEGTRLLDGMYIVILKEILGERPEERVLIRFRSILGHVLFTLEPLPLEALIMMHHTIQMEQDKYDAESTILVRMGSLLSGIHDQLMPIRPLHSSFHDFLINKARSGIFFVSEADTHLDLTLASLYIMQKELCFNPCQLESSYLRNSAVEDLTQRIKLYISPQLSYSCRFLGHHVSGATFNIHVAPLLKDILCTEKLFYWIETLSVLQSLSLLVQCLRSIIDWLNNNVIDEELILTARDGIQLVQNFGGMISESAPHLYLSALPFLPQDSIISKHSSSKFHLTAKIISGQLAAWPPFGILLTGHTDVVNTVAISKDGKFAASGSEDSTIRIWDAEIGILVGSPLKAHTDAVLSVAISPDGNQIISGSRDRNICVWDTVTGSLTMDPLRQHSGYVCSVAFSPSGERFVSGSDDQSICIWDAKTGIIIRDPLRGHTDSVQCVAFSPDSQRVVSGSYDQTICIWDTNTGLLVCEPFQGHTGGVRTIAYSPDGKKIVSGSEDHTICIWDAQIGLQAVTTLKAHSNHIFSVAVFPNGKQILSASGDTTIKTWDVSTGVPLGRSFKPHSRGATSIAISQDGQKIVSGSFDKTVYIGDVEVLQVGKIQAQHRGDIYSIDVSPDGKQVVSGSQDCTVCIWDVETGVLIKGPLHGHSKDVWSVAFSPDGQKIVSGSEDSMICIWDVQSGLQLGSPLQGHRVPVWSLAFSPDGQEFISGGEDGKIYFWDINTHLQLGSPIEIFEIQLGIIWSLAFSPDGEKIASGSHQGISIWDVKTRIQIGSTISHHRGAILSVAWSHDGSKIVSGSDDHTLIISDARTCMQIGNLLTGHTLNVRSVAFLLDGERVVSGSWDKTLKVWDVDDGQQVGYTLRGHTAYIMSVALSHSGETAFSGSTDGKIRVWKMLDDSKTLTSVNFSSSPEHSLYNCAALFEGTPQLEDWREHVYLNDDGWIVGPEHRLLLWIPMQFRSLLCTPGTISVIPGPAVELDLSRVAHGKRWTDCYIGNGNSKGTR